jgi:O-antigen ligase
MNDMMTSGAAQQSAVGRAFDRQRLTKLADGLAVALVVSLPWSTTATGVLVVLWLLAVLPTLRVADLRQVLLTPPGGLPVVLFILALLGMTWATSVPLAERVAGVTSFAKLLVIPLLLVHFRRSDAAKWVMAGFVFSCAALLVASWASYLAGVSWQGKNLGIPVKNYSSQADMFTIAIFILAAIALDAWRAGMRGAAVAYAGAALAFICNILYIATSRTALVALSVLLVVFGVMKFQWKGALGALVVLAAVGALAWPSSEFLRLRVESFTKELSQYRTENARTSAGERVEFWKKSVAFIAAAPVVGHGTGSIQEQFRRAVSGLGGSSDVASSNPHNQTLAVGIQLGFLGIAALFAMWAAHLALFRGSGLVAWIGLVVVVQNVVGSLFNSELFDFTQGWAYVIGVGVAGGALLRSGPEPGAPPTGLS